MAWVLKDWRACIVLVQIVRGMSRETYSARPDMSTFYRQQNFPLVMSDGEGDNVVQDSSDQRAHHLHSKCAARAQFGVLTQLQILQQQ
jgi:hypothetical protein